MLGKTPPATFVVAVASEAIASFLFELEFAEKMKERV